MKQKILILFFCFSLLFPTALSANIPSESREQKIQTIREKISELRTLILSYYLQQEINADSFLVVNLSDDSVIFKKNEENKYPIASITKLMTSLIATENLDPNEEIILTGEMLVPYGHSPCLFIGARVTAQDLLIISLTQSTNDASHSLTYFMEDGEFVALMNKKAQEIGMKSTFFYDAHGLSTINKSTSSDLILLLQYIYKNQPEILNITKNNDFWLPDHTGRLLKFKNVNTFHEESWFIGGKTGYLPEARQTFLTILDIDGSKVAISLLYSQNRREDTLKIIEWIKNNPTLLN